MKDTRTVIVIGSGPSGAIAAHELVRRGIRVVMLESGIRAPGGALIRVMGRTLFRRLHDAGLSNGDLHVSTGHPQTQWWYNFSPGGLSNQWTGAVPRFSEDDFTEGERLGERYRWPISYTDLAPFYEQVERLLIVTSDPRDVPNLPACKPEYCNELPTDWQHVARFAARRGQGLTVLPLANGRRTMVVGRGTAFNSYINLVLPLVQSPLFRIITGAHALKLEYSGSSKTVNSVVYFDRNTETEQRLEASAVIVACGPLNSTKLLFDSSCKEFPSGLGNCSGVLGQYLHDHPRDWWTFEVDKPLSRPSPPAYLTRIPCQAAAPLLAASWTIGLLPQATEKLMSFVHMKGHSFGVQVLGTMVPSERYYVQPDANRKDEFGLPMLDLCIHYDDDVVLNMTSAREHLLSILEDAGYRGTLRALPTQIVPGDSAHYGGTVRMHSSPEFGMLDAWNRMHEVPNVLVVDASCFTTGPEKNPTLTHMAIAMRAAERLSHDLRHGGPGED